MEPHRPIGGTISGLHNNQENTQYLHPLKTSVTQESLWDTSSTIRQKATATSAVAKLPPFKTLAREETLEESGRKRKMNEVADLKPSVMYLVLPSFAEPHKHTIKKILEAEKAKSCMNSQIKKCFDAIDFKIAFTNSKNMKQLIVRTKI